MPKGEKMKFIIIFIQILSSVLTIASAYGLFGMPDKVQKYGLEVGQLQVIFAVSLVLAILSLIFGGKINKSENGRDKKTQIQIGGSRNKQKMD